ncbi:LOW QUALITY PROTEIN: uncharacterized protein LOC103943806 [Pyrus x bretschneideri]|uniref:LOW QUALITY PROTEIN: uncharacterized protein LOC103943806 n=1 Tax=Pyrus x bretschneideri TaxID=225117 RepID=UPI00202E480D|nr:LOW QUALITY PROTEIN: uncharacterized protein LOC103943806 [Pyrus x bretschneideri]
MEGRSASENQAMLFEEMPKPTIKVTHEAKLKELLHNLNSVEIKLCSHATKEFIKLLKGDNGGDLLRYYVKNSGKCSELLSAWKLRRGKPGMFCVFKLIAAVLSHPDGMYMPNDVERMGISRALDKFARSIIEEQLQDVYKELNSKEAKRQKAALLLLASIVRRGSGLASEVAKNFDFKLQGFFKMGEFKKKQGEKRMKLSLRKSFVGFAMSFLEVGTPGLLRSVIRQKEMYSGVLRGIGNDDDETVIYVLSTLRDRILVEESSVSPSLRSVLFGSVTLEQLVNVCARENGGPSAELAYNVLVMVCTNPSNGLMSDLKKQLKGNSKRLVDLMKKLKATEIGYHRDLLLAIVSGRPSIGATYMEEFPYNLEDYSSPNWFSVVILAANLVSSVRSGHAFGINDSQSHNPAMFDNVDVQDIMKCLYPHSFSRSAINKGLLHSDFLVKHGSLRLLLEALKLLDSFHGVLNHRDQSYSDNEKVYALESFKQEFQNEVRNLLPDHQVMLTLLSSLSSHSKSQQLSLKRTAELEQFPEHSPKRLKRMKTDVGNKDSDIVVGGLNFDPDVASPKNSERVAGASTADALDNEKDAINVMAEIWGLDLQSTHINTLKDAEMYFYCRLLDALKTYLRIMPTGLEGSFEFFMNLLSSPLASETDLQCSLLSLLTEYIGLSAKSRTPIRTPPLMYKHLLTFMNLLVFSQVSDIRDQAYHLAQAAMLSTGAFDRNQHEIASWFLFLPGFGRRKSSVEVLEVEVLQSLCRVVISFLCDAVSTTGNGLFKYWDIVKRYTCPLEICKDVIPRFSPLSICVLQKCLRLLDSGSGTFTMPEKSVISTYVCSTLKYLLQTQVDARLLSSMICSVLVERLGDCSVADNARDKICAWRPLKNLLLFSQSISDQKTCGIISIHNKAMTADSSLAITLEEVKRFENSRDAGDIARITKAFSFSIISTSLEGILEKFPSFMTAWKYLLAVPVSLLSSIFFLEQTLLASVSKLWPDIFIPGLEKALSSIYCRGRQDDACGCLDPVSYARGMICNQDLDTNEAASAAFSFYLEKAPFHVLFPAIMSIDGHSSSDLSKIQDLLVAKLSECSIDCHLISHLRLVLFWLYQIRLSQRVGHLVNFQQLSEICLVLVEKLLSQLLVLNTDSDSSENYSVLLSSQDVQEVAEIIICHPAMLTLLSCPLGCSEDLPKGSLADNVNALISLSRQSIHRLDCHAFDILVKTCDYLFTLCNDGQFTAEVEIGAGQQFVKAFNILQRNLFHEVRGKFDQCIGTKDFTPFVPTFYALHVLIRFISPFELLELVHWMFSRTDMDDIEKSAISFGSCIAGGAFRNLSSFLQQPNTKRKSYNIFWKMEENKVNSDIIEEIYLKICKFSLHFKTEFVDLCLLEAINAVCRQKYMQQCNLHPLHIILSRVIASTPVEIISHCICRTSKMKARLLSLLTDMSSLHLSTFGHLFLGFVNKDRDFQHEDNVMEEPCVSALSDEDCIMLLPAALLYLNSVSLKFGRLSYEHFRCIPTFYSRIILNGFLQWKSFVSRDVFQEEFGEFLPSSTQELLSLIDDSLLGKTICMLRYHFSLNENTMKMKNRFKLFNSVFPPSVSQDELVGCDIGGLASQSLNESLNLVNKFFAKISFGKVLLFPKGSRSNEAGSDMKDNPLDIASKKLDSSRMQFMNILVGIWQWIVKRVPSVADSSQKETSTGTSLWRCFEALILMNILELTGEMSDGLIKLQSIPFLEQLMKPALLYRFEDPTTLKSIRDLLSVLSEGKFSRVPYLQLLLAHSQFEPTVRSDYRSSDGFSFGAFSRPMPGILRSLVVPSANQSVIDHKCNMETADLYARQLEVVKLLRMLFPIKEHQHSFDFGKDICINLKELHLLLLSSYGATLSEIDVEIYNLIRTIECLDGSKPANVAGMDHLWGSAVLKIEKERTLERNMSDDVLTNTEAVKERRRSQFRENLVVDPKICASTVLYFPYDRVASEELLCLNKFQTDNFDDGRLLHSPDAEYIQRYNPIFILRFSIHSLAEGYFEPLEFAGLGLLAIAFMSMSSPDDRIRRLGYDTLGRFKNTLERCQKRKGVKHIQLLLTYVQNAIEEPWQRIPSVNSIFAAETSLILLDPSHEHYAALTTLLMRSSRLNVKNILFFSNFFWSSSINFKAERLWILRLVYAGLNFDEDAQIYMNNSVLEALMSFYVSPISEDESKELILQVVKKAVKLHKMARHLVEKCGLFSWLSSVLSVLGEWHFRDGKSLVLLQLGVISEVVNDVISLRKINEWLQQYALEQLMELASHLFKFLVSDMTLIKDNVAAVNPILGTIILTLKMSQKRRIYQPHFVLSVEGSYNIYKAVKICDNARSCGTVELALKAILMSAPPADIFCLSREKISSFIVWAVSAALEADSAKMLQPKESHLCLISIPEEELYENSLISKLLRWLTASVILGKLDWKSNDLDPEVSKRLNLKTLQTLMELVESASGRKSKSRYGCEEILASAILFLQQLAGTNYQMLPSVAAALSLLLYDGSVFTGFLCKNGSVVKSLWSKIGCPAEANLSWRWAFYQPWKDLTQGQTGSQKMEELHACHSLLDIVSNVLGKRPSELLVSSTYDVDRFGAFEWERSIMQTE